MKLKLPLLPKDRTKPDSPKFPTSDFAHEMAAAIAATKKKKKKGAGKTLAGIDLEV